MYVLHTISDTVRVPPNEFGGDLKKTVLKVVRQGYDGILDEDLGIVVTTVDVSEIGEGRVIPGDGAAYYDAKIKMLMYKPEVQEITEGLISEITEFGAFVKIGPMEGLIHVSQLMDDYVNYDEKLPGFIGKESGCRLKLNDTVLARIVSVSLRDTISNSKIGLTMRQMGLGKDDWLKVEEKKAAKAVKEEAAKGSKPAKAGKESKEAKAGGK